MLAVARAQPLVVISPHDGARPHSAYVTVGGTAAPSARVEILEGGVVAATIRTDDTGRFERVLRLQPGRREIRVRCGSGESTVRVEIGDHAAPPSPATYELLQTGDVILAHDRNSQQD